tara:strand:+ start:1230 stop:1640 length:411 start_codon:yes stop_codon:yes gene_type:complete
LAVLSRPGLFLFFLLLFGCADSADLTLDIRRAADTSLTLLDRDDYSGAWDASANIFKEAVALEAWISQMEGVRKKFGKARTRTRTNAILQKDPSNHPPGEYIMINFDTGFERDDATETLVLYREEDQWRLAGYFTK